MAQVTIELDNSIADKINSLTRFFGGKDIMFDNFIEYHQKNTKREIARIESDLKVYENKYGID